MSSNGSAVTQDITGTRGSANSMPSTTARNGSTAGSISGEWNAPATGRRLPRTPRSLQLGLHAVERVERAREHELVGRVVVGDRDVVRGGHLGDHVAVVLTRAHGGHAAVAGLLGRLLHEAAARGHEPEPVLGAERAGGHQRGDLAERVAGHDVGVERARAPPRRRAPRSRSRAAPSGCRRRRARTGRVRPPRKRARAGPDAGVPTVSRMSARLASLAGKEQGNLSVASHLYEPSPCAAVRLAGSGHVTPRSGGYLHPCSGSSAPRFRPMWSG